MNTMTYPQIDAVTLNSCLASQRDAFLRDGPPKLTERRTNLKKLREAIFSRKQEFEQALIADFGNRARHETAIMEIMTAVQGIDYLHSNLRRFMHGMYL